MRATTLLLAWVSHAHSSMLWEKSTCALKLRNKVCPTTAGACRSLKERVCPARLPDDFAPSTHVVTTHFLSGASVATIESDLSLYTQYDTERITCTSDAITTRVSCLFESNTRDDAKTLVTALNNRNMVLAVDGSQRVSTSGGNRDVHLEFPGGGRADFRGDPSKHYAMLSAPGVQFAISVVRSTFRLRWARIDGTFIGHSYSLVRTARGRLLKVHVDASQRASREAFQRAFAVIECEGEGETALTSFRTERCDDVVVQRRSITVTVRTPEWELNSTALPVYDRYAGASWRLDVHFLPRAGALSAPIHGLVGQGYHGPPRSGKKDVYPPQGNFTTMAWAEGGDRRPPRRLRARLALFDAV